MSGDGATLAFYEREAADYCARWHQPSERLDPFLDRLPPRGRVLELGCGGGNDAARMIERGFDVVATDASLAMAGQAEARIGRPVRVMRFDELSADAEFDGLWAHASLLHAPRAELPDVLRRVRRALRPNGWHFASFKAGQAEGRDRFGRRFNFPDEAMVADAYAGAGEWDSFRIDGFDGGGYDGVAHRWLGITARRRV